jgi:hypothetical protein
VGALVEADLKPGDDTGLWLAFVRTLPITSQPRTHLYALYQGWIDTVLTLIAARVTGKFATAESPEDADARRMALVECARLEAQIAILRAAAAREKIARQVELNLELKRIQAEYSATVKTL